jgi:hypothetical protein
MRTIAKRAGTTSARAAVIGLTAILMAAVARPALAGPPLLCHPFEIGSAASLPWRGTAGWFDGQPGYDLQHLVADTTSLLAPATPVIVRMETLRRAAIYASREPEVAKQLLAALEERTRAEGGHTSALALFDAGYLTETLKEIGRTASRSPGVLGTRAAAAGLAADRVDGYALVQRSLALRPGDASIELASALIASSTTDRRALYAEHAQKARAGAPRDALLAKNLDRISE